MYEHDWLYGSHDFGGLGDSSHCYRDHDDDADFECGCEACGEPCAANKMSKQTAGVCIFCCPVRAAERAAEEFAEIY